MRVYSAAHARHFIFADEVFHPCFGSLIYIIGNFISERSPQSMPIFFVKQSKTIIITSYKVMYTNLRYGEHHKVSIEKLRWHHLIYRYASATQSFRKQWHIIMFVRNPYDRLMSLYLNKFQNYPKQVLRGELSKWENCHKVFFRELKISPNTKADLLAKKLIKLSFNDFVNMAHKLKTKEKHFYPQVQSKSIRRFPFGHMCLDPNEIIKLEEMDVGYIFKKTGINLKEKINERENDQLLPVLDKEIKDAIYQIYREDFEAFGYQK